ncbi:MAG: hypothetical protein D6740_08470 [Alphaproteobacteria bacterium]|nr:MAG: hypothetical protein D6740_08470 [Alphaproteobacteria bacterium]
MRRTYLVDLLFEDPQMATDGQAPAGKVAEGEEKSALELPFAFAVSLIRHAQRSRGIGAPVRRVA